MVLHHSLQDKIETYDCLVGAMNEDSNHWTLMVGFLHVIIIFMTIILF